MAESDAELVVLGGDLNTDPRWGEPGLTSLVTSGLANSFHSPATTDMHWLHPDRSQIILPISSNRISTAACRTTFGNPGNSYSGGGGGAVLDSVWHRAGLATTVLPTHQAVLLLRCPAGNSMSDHEALSLIFNVRREHI